ncbi:Transcriptional regulator, XRE family [Pseudodesulfovibrio profundus]|uniref:Transcriptional regulator, XRE family n=1 Tax=Pseudodesulfovibrio profundus TaxID=57320 RepID=A0A2C8FCJ0_9BACT|nr:helix-turn-helix domain-containing protein [Pseudodesulfovibrio profundus]SOB60504.1 Transcriptional regulator, XRE family [Pseudodesulfovibrio profundus]
MNDILLKLGKRIREFRKENGLSQSQLAEMAGLNDKYLGEVERGSNNISIKNLGQIAAALQVETFELLGGAHEYEIERKELVQKLHKIIESASDKDLCAIYGFASDTVN